ncbi:MAG: hypothetical protein AAGN46_05000 [Acidobacteriota bacterium]
MSRLYYPPAPTPSSAEADSNEPTAVSGTLRGGGPAAALPAPGALGRDLDGPEGSAPGDDRSTKSEAAKGYLEKVAKLVPSEIVAAYLSLVGFSQLVAHVPLRPWVAGGVFAACLALTPLYIRYQAEPGRPYRRHAVASTAAFLVWAYAVSGDRLLDGPFYDPALAAIALTLFTLISGLIPLDR